MTRDCADDMVLVIAGLVASATAGDLPRSEVRQIEKTIGRIVIRAGGVSGLVAGEPRPAAPPAADQPLPAAAPAADQPLPAAAPAADFNPDDIPF